MWGSAIVATLSVVAIIAIVCLAIRWFVLPTVRKAKKTINRW